MSEAEPLLANSGTTFPQPSYQRKKRYATLTVQEVTYSALLPWAVFTVVALQFVYTYHASHAFVWFLVTSCFIVGVGLIFMGFGRDRSPHMAVGLLCLMACCTGSSIGLFIYDNYAITYWHLDGGAEYTDVKPKSKGSDYADATILHFTNDSFVDTQRTLGYMEAGTVYCVAPVSAKAQSDSPQYWAAGIDCCSPRADFKCGDVQKNDGKTAVTILSDHVRKKYETAIRMATAVYSLSANGTGNVPLHWTADGNGNKNDHWNSCLFYLFLSSALYLMCSIFAAIILRKSMMRGELNIPVVRNWGLDSQADLAA